MPFKLSHYHYFLILTLFTAVFLLSGLDASPLVDWDENIYAEATRQMILRGDYLNVYINNHPFAEKPPLFFWITSLSYHLFGINEFAARLPSAIAGILSIWICFFFGKKIESTRFGIIWGVIYLTSFLPAIYARAAVIDHTFNFFIMLSAFSLYAFDVRYKHFWEIKIKGEFISRLPHWSILTLASISLGLAVLTKGPLGGVIPLVAFITYKWFYRIPKVHIGHFFYCAILSLSIALSWYIINYTIHGFGFIKDFVEFQITLFSKPLEGHQGPFFYHFLVALVGLFPWTPFLFLYKKKFLATPHRHFKPLIILGMGWTVFVLILFSFVSTKLPHYSASIYIPLSFIIAFFLNHHHLNQLPIPRWIILIFMSFGVLFSILISLLPYFINKYLIEQKISIQVEWPIEVYYTSVALFIGILTSGLYFWKNRQMAAVWIVGFTILIFTQGFWRYYIPTYLKIVQQPLIDLIAEAHQKNGNVVFYRYVSFAALFYGKQPIEMLHTYKFPGDPSVLNQLHDQATFVITDRQYKKRLKKEHPLVEYLKDSGTYSMFFLPKKVVSSQ